MVKGRQSCGLSNKGEYVGYTNNNLPKLPMPTSDIFCCWLVIQLLDWKCEETRHTGNFTIYSFNRDFSSMWKNQTATTASSSPHAWSHTAVGLHPSTHIYYKAASVVVLVTLAGLAPSMLMPQAFSCVDIRTAGRSFHALHTYILDLVSDKLHSVWVKRLGGQRLFPDCGDMDCHWLQKLILISSSTEITSDEKLCFFTEEDAALHHHTPSTKSFHRIGA